MIPTPEFVETHYNGDGDAWYYVVYIKGCVPWFVVYPNEEF